MSPLQLSILLLFVLLLRSGEGIRCSICDTKITGYSCLTNPPAPEQCVGFANCIVLVKYRTDGDMESFSRSCSPFSLPDSCVPGQDRDTKQQLQICYSTCANDGCNGSTSLHHVLDLLRRRRRK